MNRRPVTTFVGAMTLITGVAQLLAALAASGWGPDAGARSLMISGVVSGLFGGMLWLGNRRKEDERPADFHRREALASVGIGWAGEDLYLRDAGAWRAAPDAWVEEEDGWTLFQLSDGAPEADDGEDD